MNLSTSLIGFSQGANGQLIELTKNNDEIKLPDIEYGIIYVESELEKIQWKETRSEIPYQSIVGTNGSFTLDISDIQGEFLTIYFSCDDYAHIVLRNIPRKSFGEVTKIIPVIRNLWKPTCGSDCFTVNKRKTYKRKAFVVDIGSRKMVFKRQLIVLNKNMRVPLPFMDTWPPDKLYWYEYNHN